MRPILPTGATAEQIAAHRTALATYLSSQRVKASIVLEAAGAVKAAAVLEEIRATISEEAVYAADNADAELARLLKSESDAAALVAVDVDAVQAKDVADAAAIAEMAALHKAKPTTGVDGDGAEVEVFTEAAAKIITEGTTPPAIEAPVDAADTLKASTGTKTVEGEPAKVWARPAARVTAMLEAGSVPFNGVITTADQTVDALKAAMDRQSNKVAAVRIDEYAHVPEEMRLQASGRNSTDTAEHNNKVHERVMAAKAEMAKAKRLGESTGALVSRVAASTTPEDRLTAAAIATCLPGVFDYAQEICATDITPVIDGFFDRLLLGTEDGAFPLNRWRNPTLSQIEASANNGNIYFEPTKTNGVYDPKPCYELPRDCPAPVVGTVGPHVTCVTWNIDQEMTWKSRLRAQWQLVQVLKARRMEAEALAYAWNNSDKRVLTYMQSLAQTFEVNISRFMDQLQLLDRNKEGMAYRMLMPEWLPQAVFNGLSMLPGYAVPSFAKDFTDEGSVRTWFGSFEGIQSVTYAIDNFASTATTGGNAPTVLMANPRTSLTTVAPYPSTAWVAIAPAGAFVKLQRGDFTLGSSVDSPYIGYTQAITNTRFTFTERFDGFMQGRPYDCAPPAFLTVSAPPESGMYAAATANSVSSYSG